MYNGLEQLLFVSTLSTFISVKESNYDQYEIYSLDSWKAGQGKKIILLLSLRKYTVPTSIRLGLFSKDNGFHTGESFFVFSPGALFIFAMAVEAQSFNSSFASSPGEQKENN